jgi:hypothetical protein
MGFMAAHTHSLYRLRQTSKFKGFPKHLITAVHTKKNKKNGEQIARDPFYRHTSKCNHGIRKG